MAIFDKKQLPFPYYNGTCVAVTINRLNVVAVNMCWGLKSHSFPVVGNHHQTNSRDLHTPIIRIPYDKGWLTSISESLDIGWFILLMVCWNPVTYIIHPIIFKGFIHVRWLAGFLNHQQPWLFTGQVGWFLTVPPRCWTSSVAKSMVTGEEGLKFAHKAVGGWDDMGRKTQIYRKLYEICL